MLYFPLRHIFGILRIQSALTLVPSVQLQLRLPVSCFCLVCGQGRAFADDQTLEPNFFLFAYILFISDGLVTFDRLRV